MVHGVAHRAGRRDQDAVRRAYRPGGGGASRERLTRARSPRLERASRADARRAAEVTRPLAFNQGFYNLFLAILAVIGIVIALAGSAGVGIALMLAGTGSMLAAALVLILSDRGKARAAAVQGLFPLIAVVLLVVALI
jgi:putative membrane protein